MLGFQRSEVLIGQVAGSKKPCLSLHTGGNAHVSATHVCKVLPQPVLLQSRVFVPVREPCWENRSNKSRGGRRYHDSLRRCNAVPYRAVPSACTALWPWPLNRRPQTLCVSHVCVSNTLLLLIAPLCLLECIVCRAASCNTEAHHGTWDYAPIRSSSAKPGKRSFHWLKRNRRIHTISCSLMTSGLTRPQCPASPA